MTDCLFCKIAQGELKANKAYSDDRAVAFHDINPQAPVHVLIIPTRHIESLLDMGEEDLELLGHLHAIAARLARELGVAEAGFRVVVNTNRDAGQSVPHLHLHLLGGRAMGWPPG
ncbi:MAG: histidine triad nucleotide-binding protein [Armatimonadota bacterium]|nr:MAG: histidine triad nucleotide-binding protein [Armatimonadota bacterium]